MTKDQARCQNEKVTTTFELNIMFLFCSIGSGHLSKVNAPCKSQLEENPTVKCRFTQEEQKKKKMKIVKYNTWAQAF